MQWKELHHPDICPTVIRRNLECELLDMVEAFGDLVVSRGRSIGWTKCYDTPRQFHLALHRLRQAGLVVRPSRRGETPGLRLTEPTLQTMAVEILAAHRAVTDIDPFLPRTLWPDGYLGAEVADSIAAVRSDLRRAPTC